jgi:hypothetical protein
LIWIPDELPDDARLADVGVAGVGLLLLAMCVSVRSKGDGFIGRAVLRRLAHGAVDVDKLIARMEALQLLTATSQNGIDGFLIDPTYQRLQLTTAQLEERHAKKSAAGRQGGYNSGKSRRAAKQEGSKPEAPAKQLLQVSEAGAKQNGSPSPFSLTQDLDQEQSSASRASLSMVQEEPKNIADVRKQLIAAAWKQLEPGTDCTDARGDVLLGELRAAMKGIAAKLGATWGVSSEIDSLINGVVSQYDARRRRAAQGASA